MRIVQFSQRAIEALNSYKSGNQKLVFKVLDLIEDIQKNPFTGLGKPEALKGNYSGYWSRRINNEHRLVYKVDDEKIVIYKCHGHYSDE
ncbi:MAG: Txe/YoeB family addiction module toxin [Bacteroidia bacterium]